MDNNIYKNDNAPIFVKMTCILHTNIFTTLVVLYRMQLNSSQYQSIQRLAKTSLFVSVSICLNYHYRHIIILHYSIYLRMIILSYFYRGKLIQKYFQNEWRFNCNIRGTFNVYGHSALLFKRCSRISMFLHGP